MNILLVNDDGIQSDGIQVLYKRLSKEHQVFVLAPDSNRSAVSHHISIFNKNILKKYDENQWTCSGFPADCASIGLTSDLFDIKFDVCISGINAGPNLGTDIVYSGTCAGARQAILNKIPGIALSVDPLDWSKPIKYEAMADFAAKNLENLMKLVSLEAPRIFVNVNAASLDSYKGVKLGEELCVRNYMDKIKIENKVDYSESHLLPGGGNETYSPTCDHSIIREGYICVNRVYAEPVCAQVLEGIAFKL
ncbi:MAG: 5'/3'-nucleotidase SurE [Treponema sp.]|nr:5'/3'-nucleotidase SurE [Treponema sp.]